MSAKEGTFPRELATAGLPANGFEPELLSSVRVRRISPGPSCPLLLSGAGVCTVSMRGVTLPLGVGDCSCLACCEGCFTAASFFGDLPTIAVKTKKSTATASPPPRSISLPLLIPSAPLTAVRVANRVTGSAFSAPSIGSGARIGPCESVGSDDSATGVVFMLPFPFLLLSLVFITLGLPSTCHRRIWVE